jgi:F-type H+-transporting ATPase subunit b
MDRRLAPSLVLLAAWAAAPAVVASEGGGGGGGGNALITPQFGLMFWTSVTFVLLLFLLAKVAWKPLLGALAAREKGIEDTIEGASRDRAEAEALLEQHRQLLLLARKERAEAVEAGRQDAERLKAEILDEAKRQRETLLKQSEMQVEAGLRQAKLELRTVAADLAIDAAGKLLAKSIDGPTQRKLVEDYLSDLERQPPSKGSLTS